MRWLFVLAMLGTLSACTQPIDPEAIKAADQATCIEAGFENDSDAFKLCLLMQKQERRLDQRLRRLELEVDQFYLLPTWHDRR